jgi:pyruvate dehydrogenase E2 component (dihydrolipoamide acetyltransferase)
MAGKVSDNPNEFLLPDLGEGLAEAELIEWCVKVGQAVKEFDIIAKMESDKALVEVPADRDGVIAQLHGKPGEKIKVHSPLVTYEATGTSAPSPKSNKASAGCDIGSQIASKLVDSEEQREDAGTVVGALGELPGVGGGKVRAAPAVRRLARDLNVEIETVQGTGIGGRVTSADVQRAADARRGHSTHTPVVRAPARVAREETPAAMHRDMPARSSAPDDAGALRTAFKGVRRTIAERLRESVNQAVHFNVMDEADVSFLDDARKRLAAASGEKVSFLPFVAAACCRLLAGQEGHAFARLNSTVDDQAGQIVQHRAVHLGIATDTDSGLMVPVLRDSHRLGILQIGRQVNELARGARDRSIARDLLVGSTFTISNVGSYAGRFATPIINYPEVAILAVGRAREGVVVRNGMLGVGKLLPLSLACDHRVIDGATAAQFLARLIELLQKPDDLLAPAQ